MVHLFPVHTVDTKDGTPVSCTHGGHKGLYVHLFPVHTEDTKDGTPVSCTHTKDGTPVSCTHTKDGTPVSCTRCGHKGLYAHLFPVQYRMVHLCFLSCRGPLSTKCTCTEA